MNIKNLEKTVYARYSSKHDLEMYRSRARDGLRLWETKIIQRYMTPTEVLSIGCGGFRESFALETLGYTAFGTVISKPQVQSAQQTAHEIGSSAVFQAYDGTHIPFENGRFGAVALWSQVLGNVPGRFNRVYLLTECFRVLRVGGILSLSVHERSRTVRMLDASGDHHETGSRWRRR